MVTEEGIFALGIRSGDLYDASVFRCGWFRVPGRLEVALAESKVALVEGVGYEKLVK